MYTQCPACNTLFRITEKQLAAARGKVRCGHCDHIYNAQGTLMDSLPTAQPATGTQTPPEKSQAELSRNEQQQPASPLIEAQDVPDIITSGEQHAADKAERQGVKLPEPHPSDTEQTTKDSSAFTLPPGVTEDDWQSIDLGGGNDKQHEENSWLDDEHGLDEHDAEQEVVSATPSSGVAEDDWQSVELGDRDQTHDDTEDDSWFDDEHGLDEHDAEQEVVTATPFTLPSGVAEDDWQSVDLGGNESHDDAVQDSWFDDEHGIDDEEPDEEIEEAEEDTADEMPDSDFMRHVSDYLDDDAAEELISEEKATDIFDEVQQQLTFPKGDDDKNQNKPSNPWVGLSGDWLDDDKKPSKFSATSIPLNPTEEQELNTAILKSVEQPFTPVKQAEPQQHAKAEQKAEPDFESKENIVLESSKHLIGQHDAPVPPVMDDVVPLRLRNSLNIEPAVPRSGLKWLLLLSSMVILVALLLAQVVLFRSTELANMFPQWQPLLVKVCETLPCRDSSTQDVAQIQLVSRNISQHPKVKTALLIKAVILNRATFAQRYPDIRITLSDITGSTVAQRVFTPEEYLGDLYHPFLQMKPNKPVHIALEVLDPGNTAINFEFKFL